MRLPFALISLLALSPAFLAWPTTSNATHLPLLPPRDPSFPTLHTSLTTLLPLLPYLSPPPSNTLLVTFATTAFKPLLFNWICFLRHKARWASPPLSSPPPSDTRAADVPKFLVVTSDAALAKELSDVGIVVWWLKAADLSNVGDEDRTEEEEELLAQELSDDLFLNLRFMNLLLPPDATDVLGEESLRKEIIQWGTLHYQSLMLERSLAMSALVGAIVQAQRVEVEDRQRAEEDWEEAKAKHDWDKGHLVEPEWTGIKGVLVVDNDAVWLSSPSSFLSHPYRPSGTYPAILFAPDAPPTFKNAWNKYSMPCACFLYARTSSHLSHLASSLSPTSADHYRPAEDAAHAWRTTALCHISMLLHELTVAREQASRLFDPTTSIEGLVRAKAPSFQATALGPALFLLSQPLPTLPRVSHAEWLEALGSANVDDLLALLDEAQLGPSSGTSCLDLAQRNWDLSPNPQRELVDDTGVLRPDGDEVNRGARVEALPYGEFPPGMSYFGREEEAGKLSRLAIGTAPAPHWTSWDRSSSEESDPDEVWTPDDADYDFDDALFVRGRVAPHLSSCATPEDRRFVDLAPSPPGRKRSIPSIFPTFGDWLPQHFPSSGRPGFDEEGAKTCLGLSPRKMSGGGGEPVDLGFSLGGDENAGDRGPRADSDDGEQFATASPFSPFECDAEDSFTFFPSHSFRTSAATSSPPHSKTLHPSSAVHVHTPTTQTLFPLTPPRSRSGPPPGPPLYPPPSSLPPSPPTMRYDPLRPLPPPFFPTSVAVEEQPYPLSEADTILLARLHDGRIPTLQQLAPPEAEAPVGVQPIVNTGNHGPMVVQTGDWKCGACAFVNWRRRKICMRCFPFSNDIGSMLTIQSGAPRPSTLHPSPPSPPHSHRSAPPPASLISLPVFFQSSYGVPRSNSYPPPSSSYPPPLSAHPYQQQLAAAAAVHPRSEYGANRRPKCSVGWTGAAQHGWTPSDVFPTLPRRGSAPQQVVFYPALAR